MFSLAQYQKITSLFRTLVTLRRKYSARTFDWAMFQLWVSHRKSDLFPNNFTLNNGLSIIIMRSWVHFNRRLMFDNSNYLHDSCAQPLECSDNHRPHFTARSFLIKAKPLHNCSRDPRSRWPVAPSYYGNFIKYCPKLQRLMACYFSVW